MKSNWQKTNDYYNREIVTEDVWSRKYRYGKLYVIDRPASFTYTFSFGPNSDHSHTGSFYNCSKITNVEDAMNALDEIAPRFFNDEGYKVLLEKYK